MIIAKRTVPIYDFKTFEAAIKAARNEYGESRKKVSDELYIPPALSCEYREQRTVAEPASFL